MRTFIIAEAGVNHNGDIHTAKRLIDAAAGSGADAVKFQTFDAKSLVCHYASKAEYQTSHSGQAESQLEMLQKLQLDSGAHKELLEYCGDKGIVFLSTAFDLGSIDFLQKLDLEIFKIPSGEITNLPYLRKIGGIGKRIILSSGMAYLGEIEAALNALTEAGTRKEDITVLHCNTEYPTPVEDVNLNAMLTIRDALGVSVGYSDHTIGIEVAVAAVAMGAKVIEKHFTLDKNMPGPDHRASLEPDELTAMIKAIRKVSLALGSSIKKPSPSELKNKAAVRKSIVASKNITKGEILTEETITSKRPGTGISPMEWDRVVGNAALKDFEADALIEI
jgi:N,N'-diacetyllegionaminate synthase